MKTPQFVIMTYPRTGSTLVCGSLARHPQVTEGMEIFNENHTHQHNRHEAWRIQKFKELYGSTQEDMKMMGPYGQPVLDSYRFDFVPFFREVTKEFNGFKLCYHQLRADSEVWDFYINEVPVKIIYMQRDFLEACVSFQLAVRTGVWQRFNPDDDVQERSIYISPDDLQRFYRRFCSFEPAYQRRLESLDSIVVNYQELVDDWSGTMRRVQEFIGLEPRDLPQCIYKKATKSTPELIRNYDELMKKLGGLSPLEYAKMSNLLI